MSSLGKAALLPSLSADVLKDTAGVPRQRPLGKAALLPSLSADVFGNPTLMLILLPTVFQGLPPCTHGDDCRQ